MGSIFLAECSCGYKSDYLSLGGGMIDYRTHFIIPVMCPTCKDVKTVNMLEKEHYCAECGDVLIPYDDPSLSKETQDRKTVFEWHHSEAVFHLYDIGYKCPICEKFTLVFTPVGSFD